MPSKTTVDQRGLKTVPIKSTGHEKQRMTVCLAIKADGSKIKPFVAIPGKKVKSEIAAIKGAILKFSANGWMNDELTEDWVSHVWGSLAFNKSFLVWDSFKCHINEKIKRNFKKDEYSNGCNSRRLYEISPTIRCFHQQTFVLFCFVL